MDISKTKIIALVVVVIAVVGLLFKFFYLDRATLITVVGEGRVETKPQMVKFTISVLNQGDTTTQAIADNNKLVGNMISVLKNAGVKDKDVNTAYVRLISPGTTGGTQYQAVNSIDATLRDISKFDSVFTQLYKEGALSITNIAFTVDNSRNLEKQAVSLAIVDAQSRVKEIAKASGKSVGRMVSIATGETGQANALSGNASSVESASSVPSQIEVVRQASIIFELR